MDFSIVASIIVSLISVIGSFVVVYLSAIRDVFSEKQQVRREQLDNFYIPFYRRYCAGFLFRNRLSQMSQEVLFLNYLHEIFISWSQYHNPNIVIFMLHISTFWKQKAITKIIRSLNVPITLIKYSMT